MIDATGRNAAMTGTIALENKTIYTFTAILYWEEDVYVAECPEGCLLAVYGKYLDKSKQLHCRVPTELLGINLQFLPDSFLADSDSFPFGSKHLHY